MTPLRNGVAFLLLMLAGCGTPSSKTVHFAMWAGDEERNRYYQGPVAERMLRDHGITLRVIPASDTAEFVNKLLNEKRAGRNSGGSIDLVWINGENFRTAKQGGILYGPLTSRLPNLRFYSEESQRRDFGIDIEGYEAPWQLTQFVFAYDSARTPEPPKSLDALRDWIRAHPGRFTYIAPPDFTGSAFIRHVLVHFGGGAAGFQKFDEVLYARASRAALAYLNEIKPHLWQKGETYPQTVREFYRLFSNQEIDFAFAYGPSFATVRIARGEFPATVRTFVLDSGTLSNHSYLAIPFNASNVEAALVALNQLLSHEHNLEQSKALGYPYPHRLDALNETQRSAVEALPRGAATLSGRELAEHALPEPHAQYLDRFEKDWQEKVLRQ